MSHEIFRQVMSKFGYLKLRFAVVWMYKTVFCFAMHLKRVSLEAVGVYKSAFFM